MSLMVSLEIGGGYFAILSQICSKGGVHFCGDANCASKCALLCYAIMHVGGKFVIENPMTSLVWILIVQDVHDMFVSFYYLMIWFWMPNLHWVAFPSTACQTICRCWYQLDLHMAWWIWISNTKANSAMVKFPVHSTATKDFPGFKVY